MAQLSPTLLHKFQVGPLPISVPDGPDVKLLTLYKALGYIELVLGQISKGADTYGQRSDSLVTCVTVTGQRALGLDWKA